MSAAKNTIQYWLIDTDTIPDPMATQQDAIADLKVELQKAGLSMAAASRGDFWGESGMSWVRPYEVVNGSLVIPIQGILLNKFPYQLGGWATGYEYILEAVRRGLDDGDVDEIIFSIDSGGGLVAGCFEMCDDILALRAENPKPIKACVSGFGAYSAAYAVAVLADEIVVEKMAGVGSIGVVSMHVDFSANLKQSGIAVSYIFAGKHKVDGNPYEALPDAVKKRWQAKINKTYGVFVAHVASRRPLTDEEVRDTEALTFDAEESIENKLADRIGRLTHDLSAKYQETDEPKPVASTASNGETPMATEKDQAALDAAAKTAADEKAVADKAAADKAAADQATATAEAVKAGAKAERERFAAVQANAEYAGRESLATHLLSNTEMTAEEIGATLAAAPKAAATTATGGKSFADTMDTSGNPDLSDNEETDATEDEAAQATLAAAMAAVTPKRR